MDYFDLSKGSYVAIKISGSEEVGGESRELQALRTLTTIQPSPANIVRILDEFDVKGPNGIRRCLVFELLGPNVPDVIATGFPDGRLPGQLAKTIVKQALQELNTLHEHNIGHGGMLSLRSLCSMVLIRFTLPRSSYS